MTKHTSKGEAVNKIPQSTKLSILITVCLFALAFPRAFASTPDTIRVELVRHYRGVKQITISASSCCTLTRTGAQDKLASCASTDSISLEASDSGIVLKQGSAGSTDAGPSVTITPDDPSGTINIDSQGRASKAYHGSIEINIKSCSLQLVNVIAIEDYLPGVLAGEMPSSYPIEALKAQAIAARTYTLDNLRKHSSSGCDLCDSSHCQVYEGALNEKQSCKQAVADTKGITLTYNGKLASTLYCADCGGATQDYSELYSDTIPYLCTVKEPDDVAHDSWEVTYTLQDLAAKLAKAGIKGADGLQKIVVSKTSASGRAVSIDITGAASTTAITGGTLRSALGQATIKSTLFTIECSPDGQVTFKGKGFGHGIGLCQVGSKGLASPPYNYTCEQILQHYYPGTVLTPTSPQTAAHAPIKPIKTPSATVAQKPTASPELKGAGPPRKPRSISQPQPDIEIRVEAPSL